MFTQTCDKPYDRHHYKVVFKDGRKVVYCESWEQAQATWFQWSGMRVLDHIEVCEVRKSKPKGF